MTSPSPENNPETRSPRGDPADDPSLPVGRGGAGDFTNMSPGDVLRGVDATMFMRSADWLQEAMAAGQAPAIIDLRGEDAYRRAHIPGSMHIPLPDLPDRIESAVPRSRPVVCACNGSIQSAMAVVFLRTLGYKSAFNLSGGLSAWERQGRPLVTSMRKAGEQARARERTRKDE